MKRISRQHIVVTALIAAGMFAAGFPVQAEPTNAVPANVGTAIWPNAAAAKVVSLSTNGVAEATILVQTHAVAVKETGPKATVAKFGEVYDWSPAFFAVHQNEPTQIRFWNLQPDDWHTFMLMSPHGQVLMKLLLPPLSDKSYVFTFHEQGLYNFICSIHQPDMNGQIQVLPPVSR